MNIPKRPLRSDDAVIDKITEKIQNTLQEWENGEIFDDYFQAASYIAKKSCCFNVLDGYDLARYLDDLYLFAVNSDLVESLDSVSIWIYQEVDKLVKEWVKTNNITPIYKVGDEVCFKKQGKVPIGTPFGRVSTVTQFSI